MDDDDDAVVLRARGGDDGVQEDTTEMMVRWGHRNRPCAAWRSGRTCTGRWRALVRDNHDDGLREKLNGDVREVREGKGRRKRPKGDGGDLRCRRKWRIHGGGRAGSGERF